MEFTLNEKKKKKMMMRRRRTTTTTKTTTTTTMVVVVVVMEMMVMISVGRRIIHICVKWTVLGEFRRSEKKRIRHEHVQANEK